LRHSEVSLKAAALPEINPYGKKKDARKRQYQDYYSFFAVSAA
jgi:hypothetical protein